MLALNRPLRMSFLGLRAYLDHENYNAYVYDKTTK